MIISIIIPCYNEVSTIEVIIDQILSIKDYEKEIIVIDDFSTDGTREIIKEKLSNKINEIILNEKNYGKGFSVRQGINRANGDIILKPRYGNGGVGVFHIGINDKNFSSLYELFNLNSTEPLIAQEFLPAVSKGDKRILLLDGEILGAINRIPKSGEIRSNMHVGGVAEKAKLTDRDIQICDRIGPLLKDQGQFFVGIDVIGGMLTEINVTSPTGLQELERFEGKNFAGMVWDQVVKKLK